jgi:parallel beta-helix repeat protein
VLQVVKWYIVTAILGYLAIWPQSILGLAGNFVEGDDVHMSMKRILSIVLTCIVLAALLSSVLELPVVRAESCPAQMSADTIELKWDDGVAMDQTMSGIGGCPSCSTFQGVWFTLPEGLSTAVLKTAKVYAGKDKTTLKVYVTDVSKSNLMEPVAFAINGTAWYDVPLPNVIVPSTFYIWIERSGGSLLKKAPEPFYDGAPDGGHSVYGESPTIIYGSPPGDYMIRALVVPVVHVGPGQDYKTIQEAVDSVSDGWTIVVHDGTYNENVTVDKSVTIKSLSGPAKTIVQTSPPYSDNNVFRITASCVRLSGFTIQSATYAGRAGVRIENASGCVVSGNLIRDNDYGIYVSEGSANNILLENECTFNTNGIYVAGSQNYISGNKLHGNTASVGSAVYLSAIASGNQLRFNTITVDPGIDPNVAAGPQVYNQSSTQEVSAVENWWGTDTGPYNARGQGPAVGDRVLFDPWLPKQPLRVNTVAAGGGDFTMDAKGETSTVVLKQGAGTPIVSAASFGENPAGKFPGKPMGQWIDVLFSSTNGVDQVEIRQYYTSDQVAGLKEGSLRLFWWNGEKWKVCSKSSVDKTNDFVWAKLNLKTKPTPSDLTGTMFAVGIPKGGFAWWLIPLMILIVIVALIAFRLFWVLVIKRERYTLD